MNPKTKVFYQGRQINGRYATIKTKAHNFITFIKRAAIVAAAGYAVFMVGAFTYSTSTVTASTTTVQLPVQSPVLDRIADCESGNGKPGTGTQYSKSGQVVLKANTNGTVDVGKYQINSVWFSKATALGYDLTTQDGNKSMAEWIYQNKGTGDWSSSAHCWNK